MVFNPQNGKNARKREINCELSTLPIFTPLNHYKVCHVNWTTSTMLLHDLIQLAKKTRQFTIDTEHDYFTHEPALIQIEFIRSDSVILLIEACHLPDKSSVLFWLIRSLMQVILKSSNLIFSWGDTIDELANFIHFGLFSLKTIEDIQPVDVQYQFKAWYNKSFPHFCGLSYDDDDFTCPCPHRPLHHANHKWSLQRAIAYTFYEFLDKGRTKSRWSQYLYPNNIHRSSPKTQDQQIRQQMIQYAVNDCLSVTKLAKLLDFNWTKEPFE